MKFRKKPVVVEAEQWFEGKQVEGVTHGLVDLGTAAFYAETSRGRRVVGPGDWIITDASGKQEVCGDSVFRAAYEPA